MDNKVMGMTGSFLLAVGILFAGCTNTAPHTDANEVVIAFYNCENFFGTEHVTGKADTAFTPGGAYHYTRAIYEQKLHNIATVIQSMNNGKGPTVMGLSEVENSAVLHDLVHQPEIVRRNYRYILIGGPDERGINVGLLYDPACFRELNAEALRVNLEDIQAGAKTRDVLHVTGILDGDTVHLFVNHWPSRWGGGMSAPKRMRAALVGRQAIDELMRHEPATEVIFMGDLNDNPRDSSIVTGLGAVAEQGAVSLSGLYDPWGAIFGGGQGTEEFDHQWNLFDQIMVSGVFLHKREHKLQYEKAEVYKPDFLTEHKKGSEGTPRRSFAGTHWMNGYSDHFPVVLYLSKIL